MCLAVKYSIYPLGISLNFWICELTSFIRFENFFSIFSSNVASAYYLIPIILTAIKYVLNLSLSALSFMPSSTVSILSLSLLHYGYFPLI